MEHNHTKCGSALSARNAYNITTIKAVVYEWLLHMLHVLVSCVEAACWAVVWLMQQLAPGPPPPPMSEMCADGLCLHKRPQHLAVIVVERAVCWQTLADVILWSMAYGIEHVSVYDRTGAVRAGAESRLRPLLERRRRRLFGAVPNSVAFLGDDKAAGQPDGQRVTVALLCEPDGVGDMVAAARRLCGQVAAGARQPHSIDRHVFGGQLRTAPGWPDPALALKMGRLRALLGYLPWQLRLTEVLDMPRRRPLPYAEFRRLLTMYGGIQQRFGS